MTKKLPSLEEFREIRRNPLSAEAKELVRSGQWEELEAIERKELAPEAARRRYASLTDEDVFKIEAKYPLYTSDKLDWPEALAKWVEHQVKNKKKFTELRRSNLLKIADYIKKNFKVVREQYDDVEETVFQLMYGAYLIGVYCPAPYETRPRIVEANKKTTGRIPRWRTVADDLLLKTPGLPPSDRGRANKIHPELVRVLAEKRPGKKPPSLRTLRDYIGKVGKKRT